MFKRISRNNRLFMLGNFLFALSYGLWMNLRQIHLLDLGATPGEIGTVFALVALAGGLLPLPAGILSDRIGPKRVILAAWLVAAAGALTAALASTWPLASAGYVIFMLCLAANPATVSYVLLNTPDRDRAGSAEGVMATVFASWPAAMVFAPALGGLIAARLGIQANLWIGAAGLAAATCVFALAGDTHPADAAGRPDGLALLRNRPYVALAVYFAAALLALSVGYALAPTYLENARGFSPYAIGILFSVSSVGMLLFRSVIIKFEPRTAFAVLVAAAWLGLLALWQVRWTVGLGAAFVLLGAISATWVAMQASIGRAVPEPMQGLAFGLTEALYAGAGALASLLAGRLYERTPGHELPLIVGSAATLAVLAIWLVVPFGRQRSPAGRKGAGAHPRLAGSRATPGG
jgi:MFS family permease